MFSVLEVEAIEKKLENYKIDFFCKKCNIKNKMEQFKQKCDIAYEQGNPLITDADYDDFFGDNASSITTSQGNHALPFFMGSLNKIKTQDSLSTWLNKNSASSFVVSPKLDGISALLTNEEKITKLFTRGNGVKGSDITDFIKYLNLNFKNIFQNVNSIVSPIVVSPIVKTRAIRGELVMKKKIFDDKYVQHEDVIKNNNKKKEFKNSRNLVAGQFNKKKIDSSIIKDINFIAHEIITGNEKEMLPFDQFNLFKKANPEFSLDFKKISRSDLTIDNLNKILSEFIQKSEYQIDGLVITINELYVRNSNGNPKYSFAFKTNENTLSAIATVTKVQWTLSKRGFYIPVVHINPIELSNCTISKLTGYNAKYIIKNKIGEGAEIICIRSGDVIPCIVEIIKQSPKKIILPSGCWDGVHLKISTSETNNVEIEIKILTSLLSNLDVKNINIKTIEKLYNFYNTSPNRDIACGANKLATEIFFELLNCTESSLSDCFQEKTRIKIFSEITKLKLQNIKISKLISASGILGHGFAEKRINLLMNHMPHFLSQKPSIDDLCKIEGFSYNLSQKILINHSLLVSFIKKCFDNNLNIIEEQINKHVEEKHMEDEKMVICLSGFRDKLLEQKYIVVNSVTKKCKFLITSGKITSPTLKVKQAMKLNIPIISRFDFEK